MMSNKRTFPNLFVSLFYVQIILFLSSCNFGTDNGNSAEAVTKKNYVTPPSFKFNYNIFIDNSGSMNNFTPKNKKNTTPTEYQNCLSRFIQYLFQPGGGFKISTFNTSIEPIKKPFNDRGDIDNTINDLAAGKIEKGNPANTELEKILTNIIDGQHKNDINVVISDFIFDGKDAANRATLKEQIASHLSDKLNDFDYSTLVLKFHSKWDKVERTYYIMLIGQESEINRILLSVQHGYEQLGFEDFYKLSSPQKKLPAQLITLADYYEVKASAQSLALENAKMDNNNCFKCAFKIDLQGLPFNSTYLTDVSNYSVIPATFKVTGIRPEQGSFMHRIDFSTASPVKKITVELSLKNKPIGSSITGDRLTDMPALIQRIAEIYTSHYSSNDYFTQKITIY